MPYELIIADPLQNASRTNSIFSPDFLGRPFLLSSRTDQVLWNFVNNSRIALPIGPFLWNFLSKLSLIFSHFMPLILHVTTNTRSSTSTISDTGMEWTIYKLRKCANSLWNKYIFYALAPFFLTIWRRNYFFLISAHSVYKTWIIQESNKLALWNKLHFEEKKKRIVYSMFKISSTYIC